MTDQIPHEFEPQPDGEPELLEAFIEAAPSLLDDDHQRRIEALNHAFTLLTTTPGEPGGFLQAIGAPQPNSRTLIPNEQFPSQLTFVADYILKGSEEYPPMPITITVPDEVVNRVRSLNVERGVIVLPASANIDLGGGL